MQGKGNYKSGKNFLWITRPKEPRGTSRHIPHFKQETHFKQNTDSSQHVTLHKLHCASKFPVQVRCPLKMHCVLCSWCITVNQWKNLEWIICTTQCSSVQFKGEPGSEQEVMSPPPPPTHSPLLSFAGKRNSWPWAETPVGRTFHLPARSSQPFAGLSKYFLPENFQNTLYCSFILMQCHAFHRCLAIQLRCF